MKLGRVKVNHRQGVVGQIEWVSTGDHPYTGMYASGSDTAIIRFSETTLLTPDSPGLLPSLAIKFLVDGTESKNLFGMPSFNSLESWDFFKEPMRSRVEPFSEE